MSFDIVASSFQHKEVERSQLNRTLRAGVIGGGTTADLDAATASVKAAGKTNVISAQTVVTGDMRALTMEQFAKTRATMERIVAAAPGFARYADQTDREIPIVRLTRRER